MLCNAWVPMYKSSEAYSREDEGFMSPPHSRFLIFFSIMTNEFHIYDTIEHHATVPETGSAIIIRKVKNEWKFYGHIFLWFRGNYILFSEYVIFISGTIYIYVPIIDNYTESGQGPSKFYSSILLNSRFFTLKLKSDNPLITSMTILELCF